MTQGGLGPVSTGQELLPASHCLQLLQTTRSSSCPLCHVLQGARTSETPPSSHEWQFKSTLLPNPGDPRLWMRWRKMGRQHSYAMQPQPPLCPALASLPHSLSASHPYAEHCRAAPGMGSTGSLIHQSLGRAQGPSCLGPSFQVLNLLEFVLQCFHFILLQGKVLIPVVLSPAVAFFPVNIQVALERKKQLQLVGEESWPVGNDT